MSSRSRKQYKKPSSRRGPWRACPAKPVGIDVGEFIHQNPHPLGFWRDLQPQRFLHCQAVGEVVGQRTEVVDAVGERYHLLIELRFAGFFDTGVEIANFGAQADVGFAINFEHQPEHAVR